MAVQITSVFMSYLFLIYNQALCASTKIIDFIKNTELADDIKALTHKDRLIDIDLSNPDMIQSLCYNEFKITSDMTAYEISSISRKQTNNSKYNKWR